MSMDAFYKSCATGYFSNEALSLNSEQFTNNSINKVIQATTNDPFLLLEEHFFDTVLMYKKNYEVYCMKL
jgi:hypothetical protein